MTPHSRILCAVDFSEPAQAAFRQSLALSRARDAELLVVLAVPAAEPFGWRSRERSEKTAALRLESDAAGVRMRVAIQHGDPAGVILLHANARQCDLIVLGTHRRTGFDRVRSGSVAEQVTRRARCPVLVVPLAPDGATREFAGSFRNLVCPMDFSAASTTALAQALRLVDETEGLLTLVHVLPALEPMRASHNAWHFRVPEYGRLLKHDAWQRLQDVVPPRTRARTDVHARLVTGAPADAIARVASDIDADLIVMGLTSRGMMGRTLFGSTAVRVLRSAGRLMLIIPARMQRQMAPEVASDLEAARAA